jgi:D-glycero-alpha-D-manno-heptose-7-phosphate kinase
MIISRTPFRISLFGGGSDYPTWYREHGGAVLGMGIDKYCHISVRRLPPFFEHKHRIVYSRIELVNNFSEIQHPSARAILQEMKIDSGIEVHHDGDLPARSGLGSSSSFTVGMLNALYALKGRHISKNELAREAIRIEQDVIRENVGSQDQIWAAYGGLNRIDFGTDDSFTVTPIVLPLQRRLELQGSIMMFFTGLSRIASEVAGAKIANLEKKKRHVKIMTGMVDEALAVLNAPNRSLDEMGELLHEAWMLKRELTDKVSNPMIDEIYEAGREAGATGGKLLGAGGGGFMIFYVPPEKRQMVRGRLAKLINVSFSIDSGGSRIMLFEPDGLGA